MSDPDVSSNYLPAVVGSRARELNLDAETAPSPEELALPGGEYGIFVCAPSDASESLELLQSLREHSDHSGVLAVSVPPSGVSCPGASVSSPWLLARLVALSRSTPLRLVPDGPGRGLVARAMEGRLLPLFVHNVNNLMVGAMGNLDLARLFSDDADRCRDKLDDAASAMGRLSDFMSDLGRISQSLPDGGAPASWGDLRTVSTIGRLASGRSVSFHVKPAELSPSLPVYNHSLFSGRAFRSICSGLVAAALLAVQGCGEIELDADPGIPSVGLRWKREKQDGAPSADIGTSIHCLASAISCLPSNSGALSIPSWNDRGGTAALLPGSPSS